MGLIQQNNHSALQFGLKHHQAGRLQQAEMIYNQILEEDPHHAESLHLLGLVAYERGEYDLAADRIRKAVASDSVIPIFHYNLGIVYASQGRLEDAVHCYREAIRLKPAFSESFNNLGNVLKDQGKLEEALAQFSRALELKPEFAEAHSNRLLTLNYHDTEPSTIFEEHRRWARQHADPMAPSNPHYKNDKNPNRPLRLGYVSPDFYSHSVAFFIEAVLEAHDRRRFQVFCYSDVGRPDFVTERLKALPITWRNIALLKNEQVFDLVRNDEIDILVDLAGHTGDNRLLVFAHKPAPIQVSYLGYPNTTGLAAIDYRITDPWADPCDEADQHYIEELVRLPHGFLCYRPPGNAPRVGELPALQKKQITFWSCNRLSKVTPEVVDLWSLILRSVPESRLIMKSRAFRDPASSKRLMEMFTRNGVSAERVRLVGYIPHHADHIAIYNEIDIGLDSFPYNGTTTTCEALWMGVPVVVKAGNRHASRVGVSLLSSIGATDFIADSSETYVDKAVRLAGDLGGLQRIRAELRDRMARSSLTDAHHFTRSLEEAYNEMWNRYKNQTTVHQVPSPAKPDTFHTRAKELRPVREKDRKLHIGGQIAHPEWEVLDAANGPHVDHVGDAGDLSRFEDQTFQEVYSSHVLEHFDYVKELDMVLREWHRVLRPGGKLYLGVPDMDKLAALFLMKDRFSLEDRFHVMRMMFGGHINDYDYHKVGLNREFLELFLRNAGFHSFRFVDNLGIFNDTSTLRFHGTPISINVIAEKAF